MAPNHSRNVAVKPVSGSSATATHAPDSHAPQQCGHSAHDATLLRQPLSAAGGMSAPVSHDGSGTLSPSRKVACRHAHFFKGRATSHSPSVSVVTNRVSRSADPIVSTTPIPASKVMPLTLPDGGVSYTRLAQARI